MIRSDDSPVFCALKNSDLVCKDCVLKADNDLSVIACSAYKQKPGKVLDGGACPKHMTIDEAMEKFGQQDTPQADEEELRILCEKRDYLIKTFSRTNRKDYENYVIGAIWHRLNNLEIKPVSQQYVKRKDGKYALLDLYFPQINTGIECDEKYHENNKEPDKIRAVDVENALSSLNPGSAFTLIRINANTDIKTIDSQIDNAVKTIQDKYIKCGEPKWSEEPSPVEFVKELGAIANDEPLYFRTITEVAKCFGKEYKKLQQCTFNIDKDTMVWCPKLAIVDGDNIKPASGAGWINTLSSDWTTITEICPEQLSMNKRFLSKSLKRVVFAKSKNPIGQSAYRFLGVYMLKEYNEKEKKCIYGQTDFVYDLK